MGITAAVIPARGGSKGIPGKNLQRVGGVPLVARAVHAAKATGVIDRVYVSTDDDLIAECALAYGAEVIRRRDQLASDTASSESALLHALEELEASGIDVDVLVFLQATSPFIPVKPLASAVAQVKNGAADSVFSAYETYGFLWSAGRDGARGINHSHEHRPRRQDREPHYLETGAFYVMEAAGFRRASHRFFGRVSIAEVPESSAIEIDSFEQLEIARQLATAQGQTGLEPFDVDALVMDFDGVHTDDRVWVDQNGVESVAVSRRDGLGLSRLRASGLPMLILSKEQNPVVQARAAKLQIECLQGIDDKLPALVSWAASNAVDLQRIAYIGNDINDAECMRSVGWPVAPKESDPEILALARLVLDEPAGNGALRQLADLILSNRKETTK